MKALMLCLLLLTSISVNAEVASWYNLDGRKTASGEVFRTHSLTCASNIHKIGTYLKVTNVANDKSVVCKVNDRGGFSRLGRTLDLSYGAFSKISSPSKGLIKVSIKKL